MPREKWMIDPGELDEFQREVRDISLDKSYVVSGCAGSGKTILALYRAHDIRIDAELEGRTASCTIVVYTKALKSFIKSAIRDLRLDLHQVVHYDTWDGDIVDHLVIDEAQDFSNEKLEVSKEAKQISIMLYGDSNQKIYKQGTSTSEIADFFGVQEIELKTNYRLPESVAKFAAYLGSDKNLPQKCVKKGGSKPRIRRYYSWREELDAIMEEIETRNFTDTAILLPFNLPKDGQPFREHRNVQQVHEYLSAKGFSHEYKYRETERDNVELDFESELPKVMTFHSAKGLQFETVYIPFCEYADVNWFLRIYKNPIYVGVTRTYRNLFLSRTGPLSRMFSPIPKNLYDHL